MRVGFYCIWKHISRISTELSKCPRLVEIRKSLILFFYKRASSTNSTCKAMCYVGASGRCGERADGLCTNCYNSEGCKTWGVLCSEEKMGSVGRRQRAATTLCKSSQGTVPKAPGAIEEEIRGCSWLIYVLNWKTRLSSPVVKSTSFRVREIWAPALLLTTLWPRPCSPKSPFLHVKRK